MFEWLIIIAIAGAQANQPAITQVPFYGTEAECKHQARKLVDELSPRGPGTFYISTTATCHKVKDV